MTQFLEIVTAVSKALVCRFEYNTSMSFTSGVSQISFTRSLPSSVNPYRGMGTSAVGLVFECLIKVSNIGGL